MARIASAAVVSSEEDDGNEAKKRQRQGSGVLHAMYTQVSEQSFICNVEVENLSKKGGYSHCKEVAVTQSSKDNLRRHARSWHDQLYEQLKGIEASGQSYEVIQKALDDHNKKIKTKRSSSTILSQFKKLAQAEKDLIRSRALYAMHLCYTAVSFRSAECPALIEFFKSLGMSAERVIGSRKELAVMMNLLHQFFTETFQQSILDQSIASVSFTCDSWTDVAGEAYIGLSAHYVDSEFSLQSRVLEVFPFDESQTADRLHTYLKERVNLHFPGEVLIHAFTTDNGKNYVSAMRRFLQDDHLPCFAHTLQLAVRDVLNQAPWVALIAKVKEVAKATREKALHRELKKRNVKKIARFVPTRWSSEFRMMEDFVEICPVLLAMKYSESIAFTDQEVLDLITPELLSRARIFIDLFKPFAVVTAECQSTKEFVIVRIPAWIESFHAHLEQQLLQSNSQEISSSILLFQSSITTRFKYVCSTFNAITYACALHPDYSELAFADESIRAQVTDKLTDAYQLLHPEDDQAIGCTLIPLLRDRLKKAKGTWRDPTEAAVKFWTTAKMPYTMFSTLARMVFSAQATSAPSECMFSAAGHIKSIYRSKLDPERLSHMTVLRANVPKTSIGEFVSGFCAYVQQKGIESVKDLPTPDDESDEAPSEEITLTQAVEDTMDL